MFWIGLFLVVLVLVGRETAWSAALREPRWRACGDDDRRAAKPAAWSSASAASSATNGCHVPARAGRAPRADRPQRRRQDDLHQPADRRAAAARPAASLLGGEDITRLTPRGARRAAAWCAPSRSTSSSASLTPLETLALAVGERLRTGRRRGVVRSVRMIATERGGHAGRRALRPRRRAGAAHRHAALRQAAPAGDRGGLCLRSRGCCCSTSRRPACPKQSGATSSTRSQHCPTMSRCC